MMKVNLFMSMYNYTRYLRWYAALTNVHTGIVIIQNWQKVAVCFTSYLDYTWYHILKYSHFTLMLMLLNGILPSTSTLS